MSTVIAKNVQVGTSGTATDNFTIFQPATPDGTLRIGNGNTGITTSQVALTSAGNLGIGTSAPSTKLHLLTASATAVALRAGNSVSYAEFQVDSSGNSQLVAPGGVQIFNTNGSERMRIDSSGNVMVGTTTPRQVLTVAQSAPSGTGVELYNSSSANNTTKAAGYYFSGTDTVGTYKATGGVVVTPAEANYVGSNMLFFTRGSDTSAERARITSSGALLVNFTGSPGTAKAYFLSDSGGGQDCLYVESRATAGTGGSAFVSKVSATSAYLCYWLYGSSNVGSITSNGTSTTYNTTSDYRLKEQVQPITGALARNALLNPVKYKWKTNGSDGEGFIAHELQEQFPDAVTGTKDAVNADGNPVYQGVGTGPLDGHFAACVNELTALIEQQQAIITALTARVEALEGTQP